MQFWEWQAAEREKVTARVLSLENRWCVTLWAWPPDGMVTESDEGTYREMVVREHRWLRRGYLDGIVTQVRRRPV